MPGRYAIEGPGVFVPARVAAGLERALGIDEYRMKVRGDDRQLDQVLNAWHVTALQWSDDGLLVDESRTLTERWGSSEVASRVGVTGHAVTVAANKGQLVGEMVAGRWQFTPEDVAHWRATRKRGAR